MKGSSRTAAKAKPEPKEKDEPVANSAVDEIQITPLEGGNSFILSGAKRKETIKKIRDNLGGCHNAKLGGWVFNVREYQKVATALSLEDDPSFEDPQKVVLVRFESKIRFPGTMASFETQMKKLGFTKSKNIFTGGLDLMTKFEEAFSVDEPEEAETD